MYSRFAMLLADFLNLLAFLLLQFISSITDGNQHGRLFIVSDGEKLLALISIEVADPAGGEALRQWQYRCRHDAFRQSVPTPRRGEWSR